ncbi:hypothetical protein [Trueperella bialowiezensis]|uniref:Lipoprotein n=1 Tax=Trueperella bialowiezensis TaxID=312285 RepID=A0A448PF61_9ACTO|nr:hypothetical protein [Trueperella bialowiezensis]VEI13550.1 Uncharacterised protein [Trueperella bialowiezensis]
MKKSRVLAALAGLSIGSLLGLSGCSDADDPTSPEPPQSGACVGRVTWNTGSLPDPYFHYWSLKLNEDGTADFSMGGYDGEAFFEETAFTPEADVASVCEAAGSLMLRDHGELRPGGKPMSWELEGVGAGQTDEREMYGPLMKAAKAVVGQERFAKAEAAQKAREEQQ